MKKLEELTGLEKQSVIDLRYCNIIADKSDATENIRTRIVEQGGRYFFHQMQDGEVTACFEIAESWKPWGGVTVFAYTPDDLHIYEVDTYNPSVHNVRQLDSALVKPGMSCSYGGRTVELLDLSHICMNGVSIQVESNSDYVFKLMKSKIKANGGARGLYCFLDQIAERSKVEKFPLFCDTWNKIFEKYVA